MLGIEPNQVEDEANNLRLKTVWGEEGKLSSAGLSQQPISGTAPLNNP